MITCVRVLICCCLLTAAGLLAQNAPAGQQKFPPDKFVNLQVFPQDAKRDVVIQAMKNFTRALGVRCPYCHVGQEGQPLATFDFSTDANPHKSVGNRRGGSCRFIPGYTVHPI